MTTPLPPTDPPTTDDQLPGEAELAALYRQLPQREPGPVLDAAVLKAAAQALDGSNKPDAVERHPSLPERGAWAQSKHPPRREIRSTGPQAGTRRRVPRWVMALGSAASLVLVAGVAWHMRGMPLADKPAPAERAAPAQPQASEDTTIAAKKLDAPAAPPEAAKPVPLRAMAAPVTVDKADAPPAMTGRQLGNMTPAAPLPPGMKVRSGTAPFILTERPTTAADVAQRKATREAVIQRHAASVAKQSATSNVTMTALTASSLLESPAAPSAPPAASASPAPLAEVAPNDDSDMVVNLADTPEQELAKIQQLVQQQRTIAAKQRLQVFHRAHRQWKLPADLRSLLQEP